MESKWDLNSTDKNLNNLSREEKQAFNGGQNEALTFVVDQVLDEIPIVREIKDIINGESIGTVLLGIIPFGKKAKTVVEVVSDVKKTTKKTNRTAKAPLRKDSNGHAIPDPEAKGKSHTQLGTKEGRKGEYKQAREFDENGNPVRDVDFTDHGRSQNHSNPHQHKWENNPTGGSKKRSKKAEPLDDNQQ